MYAWADAKGNCILFNKDAKKNGFNINSYSIIIINGHSNNNTGDLKDSEKQEINSLKKNYLIFYFLNRLLPVRGPSPIPLPARGPSPPPQPAGYSPQPAVGGIPTLDNVLTIYSTLGYGIDGKGFLGKNYEYCDRIFNKNNTSFGKMADSMRIIYPNKFKKNEVLKHLKYRHPIHINGPKYNQINKTKMKNCLGYSKTYALAVDKQLGPKNIRYSILGWTPLESDIAKEAYICHTWGVNLESQKTTDGRYVFSSGVCDDAKYFELMGLMMCQIEAAANEVRKQTNKKVVMRVSKLGLGAWANALLVTKVVPVKYKDKYKEFLVSMSKHKTWLTIFHPDHEMTDSKTFKIENGIEYIDYEGSNYLANLRADPFGPPKSIPSDSILLIINGWDDRSFIGNKGSLDNTLDGWIVSGSVLGGHKNWQGAPIGSNFTNACYLHNSFFHPSLFTDEKKLISINC